MEGEDGVIAVVLPAEEGRQTPLADLLFQGAVALGHLVQQGGVVLLLAQLAHGQAILPIGHQPVVLLDFVLQPLDLLGYLLAPVQVVPEAVLLHLVFQGGQLLAGLGDAQCALQLAQGVLQSQELLLIIVVFNDCHIGGLLFFKSSLSYILYPKSGAM